MIIRNMALILLMICCELCHYNIFMKVNKLWKGNLEGQQLKAETLRFVRIMSEWDPTVSKHYLLFNTTVSLIFIFISTRIFLCLYIAFFPGISVKSWFDPSLFFKMISLIYSKLVYLLEILEFHFELIPDFAISRGITYTPRKIRWIRLQMICAPSYHL